MSRFTRMGFGLLTLAVSVGVLGAPRSAAAASERAKCYARCAKISVAQIAGMQKCLTKAYDDSTKLVDCAAKVGAKAHAASIAPSPACGGNSCADSTILGVSALKDCQATIDGLGSGVISAYDDNVATDAATAATYCQ